MRVIRDTFCAVGDVQLGIYLGSARCMADFYALTSESIFFCKKKRLRTFSSAVAFCSSVKDLFFYSLSNPYFWNEPKKRKRKTDGDCDVEERN